MTRLIRVLRIKLAPNQLAALICIISFTLIGATRAEGCAYWQCLSCGYLYCPGDGDPGNGIPPGTPFEELPFDWVCPICGAPPDWFIPIGGGGGCSCSNGCVLTYSQRRVFHPLFPVPYPPTTACCEVFPGHDPTCDGSVDYFNLGVCQTISSCSICDIVPTPEPVVVGYNRECEDISENPNFYCTDDPPPGYRCYFNGVQVECCRPSAPQDVTAIDIAGCICVP